MGEAVIQPTRHHRRRKHRHRRTVQIVLGASVVIGLFFLVLYATRKEPEPALPPVGSVGDDATVQFK